MGWGSFHGKEGTLKRCPQGSAGQLSLRLHHAWHEVRVPRLRTTQARWERVWEWCCWWWGGVRQRGAIVDGKSSAGPAVSYSKRLCGLAIFFILSRSPLRGFFYPSPSLSLCPHFFSSFFFISWCSLFSVYASVSSGAVVLFYRAKFVEPGPCLCLSLPGRLHLISVFLLFFHYPSVSSCLSLIHFHCLFLPVSPISPIVFAYRLFYSLFPSCIPIPLIRSQCAASLSLLYSPLLLSFVCFLPSSLPQLVKKCSHLIIIILLVSWMEGYFCSFPCGYQMGMCVSIVLHT